MTFIVDASSNHLTNVQWQTTLSFINAIMLELNIGLNTDHVAIIKYAKAAYVEVPLDRYFTYNSLKAIVDTMTMAETQVNAPSTGLKLLRDQIFTGENPDRANVSNVAVLITHNDVSTSKDEWKQQVWLAKNEGIHLVTVGLGSYISEVSLIEMASYEQAAFSADYDEIDYLVDGVVRDIRRHRSSVCSQSEPGELNASGHFSKKNLHPDIVVQEIELS